MTTLRDLAHEVVDGGDKDAWRLLESAVGAFPDGIDHYTPHAILAALDAEREAGRREALEPLARKLQCPGCDGEMLIPIDAADGSEHECACGRTMFLHLEDASEMSFGCDYCEDDPFDVCDLCGRAAEVTP